MSAEATTTPAVAHEGTDGPIGTIPAEPAAPTTEPTTTEPTTTTEPVKDTVPPTETTTAEPTPATEPVATTTATEPKKEETAAVAADGTTETSEGTLGYKSPGFINSLTYKKRHFWFSDEPADTHNWGSYLRGEKPEVAHPHLAWASQTGKGLLFYSKTAEVKTVPQGIINLSDVTDLAKNLATEFSFKLNGKKHEFDAKTVAERDSWYAVIETKIAEAKATAEHVTSSEGYKKKLETLGGSSLVAAGATTGAAAATVDKPVATPKKSIEHPKKEDVSDEEGKSKSRSRSRKRGSIFGALGRKKDELEEKKEEKKVEKDEKKEAKEEAKEEKKIEKEEAKEAKKEPTVEEATPVAGAAVATSVLATEEKKAEETPKAAETSTETTTPTKEKGGKRGSIFGTFFNPSKKTEKKEEVSPATTTEPAVAATEPATAAPATTEPATTTEEPSKTEEVAAVGAAGVAAPVVAKDIEKEKEPKEKASTSPKGNFFSKFIDREKAKVAEKKEEKTEEKAEKKTDKAAPALPEGGLVAVQPTAAADKPLTTETPATEVPSTTSTDPAATVEDKIIETAKVEPLTPAPATTTAAAESPKEGRRKSSFFGLGKKEKKGESDAEASEPESKTKGFANLIRNPSKAIKNRKDTKAATGSPPPVPATKETAAVPTETTETAPAATEPTPAEPITKPTEEATGTNNIVDGAIGDVTPDAVTVGTKPVEATA
ncbi:MAG: hypothetical protein M1824_003010 [Vezdaea acicularis]|nr:MAG: hypothetical protein M1824_003010 [Vezdaea acicularis]